jgi:hypothetical protein
MSGRSVVCPGLAQCPAAALASVWATRAEEVRQLQRQLACQLLVSGRELERLPRSPSELVFTPSWRFPDRRVGQ